jgi:hypothetical protein
MDQFDSHLIAANRALDVVLVTYASNEGRFCCKQPQTKQIVADSGKILINYDPHHANDA